MGVKESGKTGVAIPMECITQTILLLRGHKVILDDDLAALYEVETKALNRAVKRNRGRFPDDFMFQLTTEEFDNLRYQSGTSSLKSQTGTSRWGGRRYPPYAFTEQGVAMLSSVLHSDRAIHVNIEIMRAFVRSVVQQVIAMFGDKLNTMIGELLACACAEDRHAGRNETLAA